MAAAKRERTARLLGFDGTDQELAEPATNIRLGVTYLAKAWNLAKGDLCRALMKYRAGHDEDQMTPLSVEYCRRAREHLSVQGRQVAEGTVVVGTSSAEIQTIRAKIPRGRLSGPFTMLGSGPLPRWCISVGLNETKQLIGNCSSVVAVRVFIPTVN
jgi:hypothetical protein